MQPGEPRQGTPIWRHDSTQSALLVNGRVSPVPNLMGSPSRCQPFANPGLALEAVIEAVVQAAGTTLPEFDAFRQ